MENQTKMIQNIVYYTCVTIIRVYALLFLRKPGNKWFYTIYRIKL